MSKSQLKYQDLVDDMARGTHYGVFIDDTGSPGGSSSQFLPADRMSWVAVVIPPSQIAETYECFGALLNDLKKRFGVSELHFTDIYGGNREFTNLKWEDRLGIFDTIAKAFGKYRYPILMQSLDPAQLQLWKEQLQLPDNLGLFNLTKTEDTALFLLLLKVKRQLQAGQNVEAGKAHVFIDEGWKKKGVALVSETIFGNLFDGNKICFGSSKDIILIQLADFAAFVLNRMQISAGKTEFKPKERHLLEVIQPVALLYPDALPVKIRINNATGLRQQDTDSL